MAENLYLWRGEHVEHIARHRIERHEAEYVVAHADAKNVGGSDDDDRLRVWGETAAGRLIQVVFTFKAAEDVAYHELTPEQWDDVVSGYPVAVVFHARDLSTAEKAVYRRRRR